MGARGIYLYQGSKDTLFRIHGTNQPEYIGQAISSGCIRMTNEDVIDLYNRVKMGSIVVVLAPKPGDSPANPRVANANDPRHELTRASRGLGAASGTCPAPFRFMGCHRLTRPRAAARSGVSDQAAISRSRCAQSKRAVERAAEAVEQLVDLRRRDDQRRTDRHARRRR